MTIFARNKATWVVALMLLASHAVVGAFRLPTVSGARMPGGATTLLGRSNRNDFFGTTTATRSTKDFTSSSSMNDIGIGKGWTKCAALPIMTMPRIAKLAAVAVLLSEGLAYWGTFGPEEQKLQQERIRYCQAKYYQYKYHLQTWAHNSMESQRVRRAWESTKRQGGRNLLRVVQDQYRNLPERMQFVIGASLGLSCIRPVFFTTLSAIKIIGLSYIVLEFLDSFGIIGAEEGYDYDHDEFVYRTCAPPPLANEYEGIFKVCSSWADHIRLTIRQRLNMNRVQSTVTGFVDQEPHLTLGCGIGSVLGFLFM